MTNEEAKQEAIKKAYGKSYTMCKPFIDQNGWCVVFKDSDEKFKGIAGNQTHFEENEIEGGICTHSIHGKGISFKPKSLGDLECNNGWIRIEPDGSNLPATSPQLYNVYYDGSLNSFSKKETDFKFPYSCIKIGIMHKQRLITHYKPITPELRPIY